ncbi:DUF3943 domain-containing protein [Mucilaginibacter dorajii]|nr:DUF3943 domain-containing protein [Mucilaginibacter dorajii]MCS3733026.1 hypothetical protein [Mucilaginibacter dorajii]
MRLADTYPFNKISFSGLFILFALGIPHSLFAQNSIFNQKPEVKMRYKRDVRDTTVKRRFGRAVTELGIAELTPWIYDRYIVNQDYAHISWKTVSHNLNPGSWEFDNDPFQTNQFGHPYHGSMFYSAFRSNGFSFWQAVPATMAGSYLWETFAENQAPAPNDFINTSFGGIVLGEMTYRLSNRIINNQARGFNRQLSEVAGFIVNPMNGLNRLLDGRWGKIYGNSVERDSSKVNAEFDLGVRTFNRKSTSPIAHSRFGWFGRARLLYGVPNEGFRKPFSNISITAEFGRDDSSAVNNISVYGSITGWDISKVDQDKSEMLLILSANYDYIRNEAFFYGSQSVKFNLISEYKLSHGLRINANLGAGPILLAAVPDQYLYRGRNYDYGSGFAYNAGGTIHIAEKLSYGLNYRGGWIYTINGNQSHYFLHTFSSEIMYRIVKRLSIAVEPGYFRLEGNYRDHPDVDKKYPYLRASFRYFVGNL